MLDMCTNDGGCWLMQQPVEWTVFFMCFPFSHVFPSSWPIPISTSLCRLLAQTVNRDICLGCFGLGSNFKILFGSWGPEIPVASEMVHPIITGIATGIGLLTDKYMLGATNFVEHYADQFHPTDAQKDFVKAAMYGGAILGMIVMGPLSDIIGRRAGRSFTEMKNKQPNKYELPSISKPRQNIQSKNI